MAWYDGILEEWNGKTDPDAAWCVEAAASVIEDACHRQFGVDEPVPAAIRLATAMLAARLLERRDNATPLTSMQVDDVRYGFSSADADVADLIKPYILTTWWVA